MSKKSFITQAEDTLAQQVATTSAQDRATHRDVVLTTKRMDNARLVPVAKVIRDPKQPRKAIDADALKELADSIQANGLIHPVTVEYLPNEEQYKLIAGERRWLAVQQLGWKEIPAVINENVPENSRYVLQIVENVQREDLNPIEKAMGLLELKERLGAEASWADVEKMTGLSERRRKQFLALLKLPEPLQREIVSIGRRPSKNQVTEKHARALLKLNAKPSKQLELFAMIKNGNRSITGDDAMELAEKMLGSHKKVRRFSVEYTTKRDLLAKLEAEVKHLRALLKR